MDIKALFSKLMNGIGNLMYKICLREPSPTIVTFAVISFVVGLFILAFTQCHYHNGRQEKCIMAVAETAFFQGQRSAIQGDIRIKKLNGVTNESWEWISSPWDGCTNQILNKPSDNLHKVIDDIKDGKYDSFHLK